MRCQFFCQLFVKFELYGTFIVKDENIDIPLSVECTMYRALGEDKELRSKRTLRSLSWSLRVVWLTFGENVTSHKEQLH